MNFLEDIERLKKSQPVLFFTETFLKEHTNAELFLVGGAVRDLLLKRKTTDIDFDFVIRGLKKERIESWFSSRGTIDLVGRTFGVYKFLPSGIDPAKHHFIDIALPRTEQSNEKSLGGYKDFEIQSDETLPIETDLARRDFTMNAMAINMRTGELTDPFQGQEDLVQKTIRAVGDPNIRFSEDLSRILRAVRFSSQLHFTIEEKTLEAVRDQAGRVNEMRNGTDYIVSRETVGSELAKAFFHDPKKTIETLRDTRLLEILFPSVFQLCAKDHNYLVPVQSISHNHLTLAIALLLRGLQNDQVMTQLSLCGLNSLPHTTPLRINPEEILFLVTRLREPMRAEEVKKMRASAFEKSFMSAFSHTLIQALGTLQEFETVEAIKMRVQKIHTCWSVDTDEPIHPLLSGNDILSAGVPPGPNVRLLLELLRDEQLDGKILNRESAKAWLQTEIKKR